MSFMELQHGKRSKFGKARGKTPKLFHITDLSCPFLFMSYGCPYFLE